MDPSGKGPIGGVWGAEGRQELDWANSPLRQSRPIRFVTVRDWLHITVHHVAVFKGMWHHPTLRCFVQHVPSQQTEDSCPSIWLLSATWVQLFYISFFPYFCTTEKTWYICTYECTKGGRDANKLYWIFHSKSWESCRQMLICSLDADIATLSGLHYHYLHTQWVGATFAHVTFGTNFIPYIYWHSFSSTHSPQRKAFTVVFVICQALQLI